MTIYLILRTLERGYRPAIAAGGTAGLTILCRTETALFCMIILMLIFFLGSGGIVRRSVKCILIVVSCFVTLVPWMMRNYVVVGAPVLTSNAGVNLYGANNPTAKGGYYLPDEKDPDAPNTELENDRYYFKKGLEYIYGHPRHFVSLIGKRQALLWSRNNNLALDLSDFFCFRWQLWVL